MTESEDTRENAPSSSSGGSNAAPRKRATRPRRKTGARRKTTGTAAKPAARRTRSPRRARSSRRRASSRQAGLERFLNDLAKRANRAGSKIADLSEEGADAARRTLVKAGAASRQTIARVKREWDRMDAARKVQFVGALLGALAAATAAARKMARK